MNDPPTFGIQRSDSATVGTTIRLSRFSHSSRVGPRPKTLYRRNFSLATDEYSRA
jgi:hypothetical protein